MESKFNYNTQDTQQKPYNINFIIKQSRELGIEIIAQYKKNKLKNDDLKNWLQYRNVINMRHVATAFARKNLFYGDQVTHLPVQQKNSISTSKINLPVLTTVTTLAPFTLFNSQKNKISSANRSYMARDENKNIADTLTHLLFSHTSLECSAALDLVHYLTIYDFLKLIFKEPKGSEIFNSLFRRQKTDYTHANRFTLGSTEHTSIINFFIKKQNGLTVEDLCLNPKKYVGQHCYIQGHKDYDTKNRTGFQGGWNVIFFGLDKNKQPLFLGPFDNGQKIILSYDEILADLVKGFNSLPPYQTRKYASWLASEEDILGLDNSYFVFDLNKIKLLLNDKNQFDKKLKQFCRSNYQYEFSNKGDEILDISNTPNITVSYLKIMRTRDDSEVPRRNYCSY